MTNGSCHSTCESHVQPWLKPASSACRIRSTTALAGGLFCSTTPKSIPIPSEKPKRSFMPNGRWCALKQILIQPAGRKVPWPGAPVYSPLSITVRPRDSVVTTRPVISMPSYAE